MKTYGATSPYRGLFVPSYKPINWNKADPANPKSHYWRMRSNPYDFDTPKTPKQEYVVDDQNSDSRRLNIALTTTKHGVLTPASLLLYTAMLIGTIAHSTAATKVTNNGLRLSNFAPAATNVREDFNGGIDRFYANSPEFESLALAIATSEINTDDLSIGNNSVILDEKSEVDKLHKLLSESLKNTNDPEKAKIIQQGINTLSRLRHQSSLIFGDKPLTPESISQYGEPNCQGMSALKGMLLTEGNTEHLKGSIEVVEFNPDSPDNLLQLNVHLNGKTIPVSYDEIVSAMSKKNTLTSRSKDNSLFTTIYSIALKKGAYPDTTPNLIPTTSVTLLTSNDYDMMLTYTLSDDALHNLFKQAPERVILVTGTFDFGDIKNGIDFRSNPVELEEESPSKAKDFIQLQASRSEQYEKGGSAVTSTTAETKKMDPKRFAAIFREVFSGLNKMTPQSKHPEKVTPPTTPKTTSAPTGKVNAPQTLVATSSFPPSGGAVNNHNDPSILPARFTRQGHVYAVESYDEENRQVIITDAHGSRIKLSLEETRKHLLAAIAPSDSIPINSDRTPLGLLFLSMMAGMFVAERRLGYGVGGASNIIYKSKAS